MEIATELKEGKYIDIFDGMLDRSPFVMAAMEMMEEYKIGGWRLKEYNDVMAIGMELSATDGVMVFEPRFFEYGYAFIGFFYKLIYQCNKM